MEGVYGRCVLAGVWWTEAIEALGLTIIVASDSGLRLGLLCSCAALLLGGGGDGEMGRDDFPVVFPPIRDLSAPSGGN